MSNIHFGELSSGLSTSQINALSGLSTATIAGVASVPVGDWQYIKEVDQNLSTGSTPTFNGVNLGGSLSVIDSGFSIKNNSDNTKELQIDCENIPPSTTNTLVMAPHSIDLGSVDFTGFSSWGGTGNYYMLGGGTFILLRPVNGYINGKFVHATAPSSGISLSPNVVNYIYVNSSGIVQTTPTRTLSLYQNNILLFEILYDSGTGLIVKNEQHSAGQNVIINDMIHDNVGSVLEPSGGVISIGSNPRSVQISAGTYNDQDINFGFSPTNPIPIQLWYVNGAGEWTYDNTYTTNLPIQWNNAGSLTPVATNNQRVIYRLYITNNFAVDGTLSSAYIGVVDTQVPFATLALAQSSITANTPAIATNELFDTEVAQLGFIVMRWQTGSVITVNSITVSKSTYAQNVSGGIAGPSHLTLSDLNGGQYGDGGHSNLEQAVQLSRDPINTDDSSNYKISTLWYNNIAKTTFICTDNTASNAIWKLVVFNNSSPTFTNLAVGGAIGSYPFTVYGNIQTITGNLLMGGAIQLNPTLVPGNAIFGIATANNQTFNQSYSVGTYTGIKWGIRNETMTNNPIDVKMTNIANYVGINQLAGTNPVEMTGNVLINSGSLTVYSNTPSSTQWGYLAGLNQALTTTSSPSFTALTTTGNMSTGGTGTSSGYFVCQRSNFGAGGYEQLQMKNQSGAVQYTLVLSSDAGINASSDLLIENGISGNNSLSIARDDTVSTCGKLVIGSTTDSASTSTGSLTTAGGIGVAKNLYVGGTVNSTGNMTINSTTSSTSTNTGSITTAGGIGVAESVAIGKYVLLPSGITTAPDNGLRCVFPNSNTNNMCQLGFSSGSLGTNRFSIYNSTGAKEMLTVWCNKTYNLGVGINLPYGQLPTADLEVASTIKSGIIKSGQHYSYAGTFNVPSSGANAIASAGALANPLTGDVNLFPNAGYFTALISMETGSNPHSTTVAVIVYDGNFSGGTIASLVSQGSAVLSQAGSYTTTLTTTQTGTWNFTTTILMSA